LSAKGCSGSLSAPPPVMKRLLAAVLVVLAWPSAALAADVRLVTRDEPVGGAGALRARAAPVQFNLVGIHWRGPGDVWFRTALAQGQWSAWQPARPEAEDLPDPGTAEARARGGWKIGNPYWTGPARFVQYRVVGKVRQLRGHFLWSPPVAAFRVLARPAAPAIISRASWGADESIVRGAPSYAPSVRFAVVHHTAGTNSYTAAQSAAIVRGIQRYHVVSNGWNDIGYNFLVDKYGQVFEGRAGGIDQPVIGAHAGGFNTGSTGVALLGTYGSAQAPGAAADAIQRLLAWRLDVAHVDPLTRLTAVSGGNERFPAGTSVSLRAVSGHRDTGSTSCPGNGLYSQLSGLASQAAAIGLPKLYEPQVHGGLGGSVRFAARLSEARPWSVAVADATGQQIAGGTGDGTAVDWTWDARAYPAGTFRYTISAGPEVTPATGRVPGPPPLEVSGVIASPRAFSPNGDGVSDSTQLVFTLSVAARVTVTVIDGGGAVVRRVAIDRAFGPGRRSVAWNGVRGSGAPAADGRYRVRVDTETEHETASGETEVVVDRTLGHFGATPAFSPNGDGRLELAHLSFQLARAATVRVRIMAGTRRVATLESATLQAGTYASTWNGSVDGRRAADRRYTAVVTATTVLGTRSLSRPVRLDTRRPRVRVLSARRVGATTRLRLVLSEAARLRIRYGSRVAVFDRPAGTVGVRLPARVRTAWIVAIDAAANRSPTLRVRAR
jgi:flagellar hook assembly protein FlgD